MLELKFHEYCATKNPKYLVIFLHGYGANGENLIGLAPEFKRILPDAHFISPNAIQDFEGGFPNAFQWFSLYGGIERKSLDSISGDIKNSNKILADFISDQLTRFNLAADKLFLVGFSQGAMMAIYQGLIAKEKPAGVIAYSGRVILPEMLGAQTISKPDICLIHGEADSVVPFTNFLEGKEILHENKIPFEAFSFAHLDHSIDFNGVKTAQKFIKKLVS